MSVSRPKGPKGRADLLASRIVRSRGQCQRCHTQVGPFDCAHIVGRRYSATRCVEDNLLCLCRTCHMAIDEWPHEKMWMVEGTIGVDRYKELCAEAQAGIRLSSRLFWVAEVERLLSRCTELGIDTRWRVPA